MEFGRLPSVDGLDLSLPPDPPGNAARLAGGGGGACDLRMGLPSWSDPGLAARLGGSSPAGVLRAHAGAVPSNELNSTFYGYTEERLARWAAAVPEGFRFCCKLPRTITHDGVLERVHGEMEAFVAATRRLGARRGPTWFALPPFFARDRLGVLADFLGEWAPALPLAVEVRHPSWFDRAGLRPELSELLRSLDITAIITDTAGRRDCAHMQLTTPRTLVRFVGNGLHPSDFERLDRWGERLVRWADAGLQEAYFFFHQRDEAQTLDLAEHLERRLAAASRPVLAPWREASGFVPPGSQLGLFGS